MTSTDTFDTYVMPEPNSGCHLWAGALNSRGKYPSYRGQRAHHVALMRAQGLVALPPGVEVCHTCDTPQCVNPDHLFLGTKSDNMRDAARKGRLAGQRDPGRMSRLARLPRRPRPRATHCRNGHELTVESTTSSGGRRRCIACSRAASARYEAANREWRCKGRFRAPEAA